MTDENAMREWATLVVYERRQMKHARRRLATLYEERDQADEQRDDWQRRLPDWKVEANAFLESFCVHYRNLQDFLSPRDRPHELDVTAGLFLGKVRHFRLVASDSPAIKDRDRLDKGLAHISKARTTLLADQKEWAYNQMTDDMDREWQRFLTTLRESGFEDRAQWFIPDPADSLDQPSRLADSDIFWKSAAASTHSIGPITGAPEWMFPSTTGRAVEDVGDD